MKKLRTFIAITPPENVKKQIKKVQEKLQKKKLPVKWEDAQKSHITIVFLGHITQARMEAASGAVQKTAEHSRPFEAYINGLSYFYKRGADSIIYLDLKDPERIFKDLYRELFRNLADENFYPPTRFTPHLTLGRLSKQRHEHDRKRMLQQVLDIELTSFKNFTVKALDVYESIYDPGRHGKQKYHLLKSFSLAKME